MSGLLRKFKFYSISKNVSFNSEDHREIREYKELLKYLYDNNGIYYKRSFINLKLNNDDPVLKYINGVLEYNIKSEYLKTLSYKYGNSISDVGHIIKYMYEDYYKVKITELKSFEIEK
jgi:hypothetical protein